MKVWLRQCSLAWAQVALSCVGLLACDGEKRRLLWAEAPENDASPSFFHDAGPHDAGPHLVPTSVTLTERWYSSLHGGKGGDVYGDTCPANQVLVGARGSLLPEALGEGDPPWISSIAAICAEVSLLGDAASAVSTGPVATLQERGTMRDMTWIQQCPDGQIAVGMAGRSGEALDRFSLICAAWQPSESEGRLVRADDTALGLPSAGGSGGSAFEQWCPEGQLATGFLSKAHAWVDALGISCATAMLAR